MMKKKEHSSKSKKEYAPPQIKVETVMMEHSIAAQSATVTVVGGGAANTPDITDWQDQGTNGDGTIEF